MHGRILLILPQDVNMTEIDRTFFAEPQGWSLTLQTNPLSR